MSTETNKHKTFVTSIVTAGVVGLAFVLLKYRRAIFNNIRAVFSYNNPLKFQHIEVINTREECKSALEKLKIGCRNYRVLGFDCEWVTVDGHRHPVALLQLASQDGFCALFRLCKIRCIPEELKKVLEDLTIYKVGVGPIDDARYLFNDYNVNLNGIVDLRYLAFHANEKSEGLASLAKSLLNVQLDKNWRIRCSDWEADTLTDKQLKYAATDAHVGIEIFKKLTDKILKNKHGLGWRLKKVPEKWIDVETECADYVNMKYKYKRTDCKNKFVSKNGGSFESLISAQQQEGLNQPNFRQPKKNYHMLSRTKPLYQNCVMQKQNGDILCTCDMKKAKWYVDKQLASVVSACPYTIRLNFVPAGENVMDVDKYYQAPRENRCVVCGRTNTYNRKNVVPREYRKLFPDIGGICIPPFKLVDRLAYVVVMKSHTCHDVLLLCASCHQISNARDQLLRQRLGDMCGLPLVDKTAKYTRNQESLSVASAAKALLEGSRKHVIPAERKEKLRNDVLKHFKGADELTDDMLKEAYNLTYSQENPDYESHGQSVVEHFGNIPGGLFQLEQMWRQHFLDSMRPRFMPQLWSVDHNKARLQVRASEGRLDHKDRIMGGFSVENDVFCKETLKESCI